MTPTSMHHIQALPFRDLRNTRFKLCQHKVGEFTVVIIDVTFGSQDLKNDNVCTHISNRQREISYTLLYPQCKNYVSMHLYRVHYTLELIP